MASLKKDYIKLYQIQDKFLSWLTAFVFDIVYLALNYSFNWMKIFNEAKTKAIINEIDIVERLGSFPLEWLNNVDWISKTTDYENFKQSLNSLANDFLLGKDNSICIPGCKTIENAILLPDLN